jgi:hypothetical protein
VNTVRPHRSIEESVDITIEAEGMPLLLEGIASTRAIGCKAMLPFYLTTVSLSRVTNYILRTSM